MIILLGVCLCKTTCRFDCKEVNNTGNITCNCTLHSGTMDQKKVNKTGTNCQYDPAYLDKGTTDCETDEGKVRIECPYHINSTVYTTKCRMFTVNTTSGGFGTYDLKEKVTRTKDSEQFAQCTQKNRYPYVAASMQWQKVINCIGSTMIANCFTYAKFYPTYVWCEFMAVKELQFEE